MTIVSLASVTSSEAKVHGKSFLFSLSQQRLLKCKIDGLQKIARML